MREQTGRLRTAPWVDAAGGRYVYGVIGTNAMGREDVHMFNQKLREISTRYGDLLTFHTSAPAAPHSFLSVQLALERAE